MKLVESYRLRPRGDGCVARDRGAGYETGPAGPAAALAKVREGLAELQAADVDAWSDEEVAETVVALEAAQQATVAQQTRVLGVFDARAGYRRDACVSTASWLRWRTRLGYGPIQRRVHRMRLLGRMPALRAAFTAGAVSVEHVDAVARRATGWRADRLVDADDILTGLAVDAEPRDVAVVVAQICDAIDPDATDDALPCDDDDLRAVSVRAGYAGLGDVTAVTTPVLTELLLRVRDVYATPDAADTPAHRRRTSGQRFHDALTDALTVALDHHPGSTVDGVKTHIVLFADLATLLGRDDLAVLRPRLSQSGVIDPDIARHLVATSNPTLRAVLTLGPWKPVTVGRTHRTLPDWLRGASELIHQRCRGPGCTLRFSATEADHTTDWAHGGPTALFNDTPLCHAHHRLKHLDRWAIEFDTTTGTVTWTARDHGRTITVPPPPL